MEASEVIVKHIQLVLTEKEAALLLVLMDPLPNTPAFTEQANNFCIEFRAALRNALKAL